MKGINPLEIATELYRRSGDTEFAEMILRRARRRAKRHPGHTETSGT